MEKSGVAGVFIFWFPPKRAVFRKIDPCLQQKVAKKHIARIFAPSKRLPLPIG
ncbi:MAG: hypothetical protein H6557_01535 [Lewinellaceae bacterium]|nr:hypothetical protein [Lewinellaceae bacterium]